MKSAILSVALLLFLNLDLMASQGVSNCRLPKLTGFCRGRFPRFYYNAAKGRCEGFIYGGCGGNGNNFKTLKECQQTCICPLPPQTGHCRGYFPRYHFDEASGQCKKFIYGGCGGNENNFKTLKECQQTCICSLPSQTGLCKGYFPRYHFDEASGQCEKFIYGGCGGNENNFKTLKECQQTCGAK